MMWCDISSFRYLDVTDRPFFFFKLRCLLFKSNDVFFQILFVKFQFKDRFSFLPSVIIADTAEPAGEKNKWHLNVENKGKATSTGRDA